MKTARIETLCDGVFAIVLTLMIFDIRLPALPSNPTDAELTQAILGLLPNLTSFLISFIILGVYWVGTHSQYQFIRRADQRFLWINLLFLLGVSLVPFSANLLGRYGDRRISVILYGANLIGVSMAHWSVWLYATRKNRLVDADIDPTVVRLGTRLSLTPVVVYVVALLASFISPTISVLLYGFMLVPYVLVLIFIAYRGRVGST